MLLGTRGRKEGMSFGNKEPTVQSPFLENRVYIMCYSGKLAKQLCKLNLVAFVDLV